MGGKAVQSSKESKVDEKENEVKRWEMRERKGLHGKKKREE